MQTIDPIETSIQPELMATLEDIARNVEVRDDFSIHHPLYKPLELPAEAIARFQQMPQQIGQKFLNLQLRNFLYGIYYNGSMRNSLALDNNSQTFALDLENNSILGIDVTFFARLHHANCGQGYFDDGWIILRVEDDQTLIVNKGSLRLCVDQAKYLAEVDQQAQVGSIVSIKMPKNRMQNGFYMAVGDKGFTHPAAGDTLVRIYVNLTPDGSVLVMESLTKGLNKIGVSFSFKVLYNPQDYNRYDSGVLYFDAQDYSIVAEILGVIFAKYRSHFLPEIPLFTKQLANGMGVAEEPNQKFGEKESFGMNRCQMIANGLLDLFHQGNNSFADRMGAILSQFSISGISLQQPYLNSSSQDIYYSLD